MDIIKAYDNSLITIYTTLHGGKKYNVVYGKTYGYWSYYVGDKKLRMPTETHIDMILKIKEE